MKLIYITNTRLPSEKANSYQSVQMCNSFSKIFKNVEMWVPKAHNTPEFSDIEDIYSFYNVEKNFKIRKFFQFDSKILGKFNEFIWANTKGSVFALNVLFSLFKYRKDKNVVIYTRDWYLLFFYSCIMKTGLFKNKVFYEGHKFSSFLLKWIKKIDGLIVINNYLYDLHKHEGLKNILVAHDGVNLEEYKDICKYEFNKNKDVYKIVYTGSLFQWKGVYTLVDAMSFISKNVELIIVGGSGKYLNDFKNYIKQKGLDNIKVISHIPKNETISYIQSADLLLLPNSAKDKMSLYTSPIKLFEYMASNRVIVASNLPSLCEILEDNKNAVLFQPDNPKDLALKIDFVLNTDCSSLVNQAWSDVQEYSWDQRAKNIKKHMLMEL